MNEKIDFPALVITDKSIDKINYRYLVSDKRFIDKAFRNVLIVDYTGKLFDIKGVIQDGGVDFLYSVRLVGYMVKVKPQLNRPVENIELAELQKLLISIVSNNPRSFASFLDTKALLQEIKSKISIPELINIW